MSSYIFIVSWLQDISISETFNMEKHVFIIHKIFKFKTKAYIIVIYYGIDVFSHGINTEKKSQI